MNQRKKNGWSTVNEYSASLTADLILQPGTYRLGLIASDDVSDPRKYLVDYIQIEIVSEIPINPLARERLKEKTNRSERVQVNKTKRERQRAMKKRDVDVAPYSRTGAKKQARAMRWFTQKEPRAQAGAPLIKRSPSQDDAERNFHKLKQSLAVYEKPLKEKKEKFMTLLEKIKRKKESIPYLRDDKNLFYYETWIYSILVDVNGALQIIDDPTRIRMIIADKKYKSRSNDLWVALEKGSKNIDTFMREVIDRVSTQLNDVTKRIASL